MQQQVDEGSDNCTLFFALKMMMITTLASEVCSREKVSFYCRICSVTIEMRMVTTLVIITEHILSSEKTFTPQGLCFNRNDDAHNPCVAAQKCNKNRTH